MKSISGEYLAVALDKLRTPGATHASHFLRANPAERYEVVSSRASVLARNFRAKYLDASDGLEDVTGLEQMLAALAKLTEHEETVRGLVLGTEPGVSFTVVLDANNPVAIGVLQVSPSSSPK